MDADLIEWADKFDQANTVEEMIAVIESMPPDVAARWAEWRHPTYCAQPSSNGVDTDPTTDEHDHV